LPMRNPKAARLWSFGEVMGFQGDLRREIEIPPGPLGRRRHLTGVSTSIRPDVKHCPCENHPIRHGRPIPLSTPVFRRHLHFVRIPCIIWRNCLLRQANRRPILKEAVTCLYGQMQRTWRKKTPRPRACGRSSFFMRAGTRCCFTGPPISVTVIAPLLATIISDKFITSSIL